MGLSYYFTSLTKNKKIKSKPEIKTIDNKIIFKIKKVKYQTCKRESPDNGIDHFSRVILEAGRFSNIPILLYITIQWIQTSINLLKINVKMLKHLICMADLKPVLNILWREVECFNYLHFSIFVYLHLIYSTEYFLFTEENIFLPSST